jgi:anti-sigma factor RsiW
MNWLAHRRMRRTVSAYLDGEVDAATAAEVADHLRHCQDCSGDAELIGLIKTSLSNLRVGDVVQTPRRGRRRPLVPIAAAVIVIIAVAALTVGDRVLESSPDPVASAVADYRNNTLPGSAPALALAPDLSAVGLTAIASAAGDLDGQPVTGYAYRDRVGRRVSVYVSDHAFPMPSDAEHTAGPGGPWTVSRRDVRVVCVSAQYEVLVVGGDADLVDAVADSVDVS